jgi:ADP-ribosylglycohydrolase
VGGGPFGLKPGEWTDDTAMALCMGNSLIECRGFNPAHQLMQYVRWYKQELGDSVGACFDIGMTTRTALVRFIETSESYCGSTHPGSAGNGSLMRLTPVPLFFARCPAEAIEKSGASSRTTHGAAAAVDACRYYGGLIVGAVQGKSKEQILAPKYSPVGGYWERFPLVAKIDEIAAGSFKRKNPPEIAGEGYVVRCLEAALWAFHHSTSFADGCLKAVNLGDDADTTGAVYNQLAGAYYGYPGIPERWRGKLRKREMIESLAESLFRFRR